MLWPADIPVTYETGWKLLDDDAKSKLCLTLGGLRVGPYSWMSGAAKKEFQTANLEIDSDSTILVKEEYVRTQTGEPTSKKKSSTKYRKRVRKRNNPTQRKKKRELDLKTKTDDFFKSRNLKNSFF